MSYAHLITVGRSATAVKVKVKGQGYRFVFSQWSRSLSLVNGQWHITFPQLILVKEQFMQVYNVIQNYT